MGIAVAGGPDLPHRQRHKDRREGSCVRRRLGHPGSRWVLLVFTLGQHAGVVPAGRTAVIGHLVGVMSGVGYAVGREILGNLTADVGGRQAE